MGVREGVEDLSVMRVRVGVARLKCAIYRRYTELVMGVRVGVANFVCGRLSGRGKLLVWALKWDW